MDSSLTASDVALMSRNGDGWGNNSFMWIFALLILLFGGGFNGGFGNRYADSPLNTYATAASQQEILFGQQFQTLNQAINKVGDGLCSGTYALNNSILGEGRAIQTQLANCCCENQKNVDALRYDMATMFATSNANTTAQTQKILDAITANKMAEMQNQINQLQLQNAVCGVVRYPMATTYTSGLNPFCGCGCQGGTI